MNVNLPHFIEQYAKNELTKDYKYDFFNENKEEIYANISICFNINHLFYLINGLKKEKEVGTFNLGKCFQRLCSEDIWEEIKSLDEEIKKNHKEKLMKKHKDKEFDVINYYIYNDKEIEGNYDILFKINNNFSMFNIDIKNINKTKCYHVK